MINFKSIINGTIYDTRDSKQITFWSNADISHRLEDGWECETLYACNADGSLFLVIEENGTRKVVPMTDAEAKAWSVKRMGRVAVNLAMYLKRTRST